MQRLLQLGLAALTYLQTACLKLDESFKFPGYTLGFVKRAWVLCSHGVQLLSEAPDCWTNQAERQRLLQQLQVCSCVCGSVCTAMCCHTILCALRLPHLTEPVLLWGLSTL